MGKGLEVSANLAAGSLGTCSQGLTPDLGDVVVKAGDRSAQAEKALGALEGSLNLARGHECRKGNGLWRLDHMLCEWPLEPDYIVPFAELVADAVIDANLLESHRLMKLNTGRVW
jgi:hypothetical protein